MPKLALPRATLLLAEIVTEQQDGALIEDCLHVIDAAMIAGTAPSRCGPLVPSWPQFRCPCAAAVAWIIFALSPHDVLGHLPSGDDIRRHPYTERRRRAALLVEALSRDKEIQRQAVCVPARSA